MKPVYAIKFEDGTYLGRTKYASNSAPMLMVHLAVAQNKCEWHGQWRPERGAKVVELKLVEVTD